jgi:hypothetical protein
MDLQDVITQAGLAMRHRGFGPCPVCRAAVRGHHDRRPPVTVYWRDGAAHWHCKASGCGAGGGVQALRAALRFGEIPPAGDPRWATLHDQPIARAPRAALPPPPDYPPVTEVQALWRACRTVDAPEGGEGVYFDTRGISAARVAMLDLSRSLVLDAPLPAWVPRAVVDTRVSDGGYRLVTPMFDALGTLRSVRFRATGSVRNGRKTLNPQGFGYAGLVMADPMAQALLRGTPGTTSVRWDGRIVVVEGEPDFWTWATHAARFQSDATWAVFAIAAGSWSPAIAARIPDTARVIVRTHHDPAGNGYAARIRQSFTGRPVVVVRSRSPSE